MISKGRDTFDSLMSGLLGQRGGEGARPGGKGGGRGRWAGSVHHPTPRPPAPSAKACRAQGRSPETRCVALSRDTQEPSSSAWVLCGQSCSKSGSAVLAGLRMWWGSRPNPNPPGKEKVNSQDSVAMRNALLRQKEISPFQENN